MKLTSDMFSKIHSMTREEIRDSIEQINDLKKALETELSKPNEFKLKYDNEAWIVGWMSPSTAREATVLNETIVKNGGYRMRPENSLMASKKRINANILEAIGEQLEPDYETNYLNIKEEKCFIKYNILTEKFEVETSYNTIYIGIPVFSLSTAHAIKKMLNDGKIKLYNKEEYIESTKN